jgi:hypothetical protein
MILWSLVELYQQALETSPVLDRELNAVVAFKVVQYPLCRIKWENRAWSLSRNGAEALQLVKPSRDSFSSVAIELWYVKTLVPRGCGHHGEGLAVK